MDANAREWSGSVLRPGTEILLLIRVYSRQFAVFHVGRYSGYRFRLACLMRRISVFAVQICVHLRSSAVKVDESYLQSSIRNECRLVIRFKPKAASANFDY
jgi:hypothetical protein